ncbi:MAG TPA: protein kinase [Thermoanaerobaculia bacterium]|jgi:Tol biopolymer transport system component
MTIAKGALLGPYEIQARIGAGGMGEVWRARDKRIGRDVAVKILPEEFTEVGQHVRRFEQEARAAGSLNHPGLVTIFDVGTIDGAPYIVMELLEGETLRDTLEIAAAPLPMRKAIDYAAQLATALAVAHEKGIIHRDLKPENIFVTKDRRLKILDFGLAKLAEEKQESERRSGKHLTSVGIVVGTPAYMSPEQARGLPIDHRTDIFSLGSIMYEMLSGRQAFDAFSAIETMHAVLATEPPPLPSIVPDIPPALDAIVRHCMEKDPHERFQSARDLAFQLSTLPEAPARSTVRRPAVGGAAKRRLWSYPALIALLAGLALFAGGFALFRARAGEPHAAPRTFKQLTFGDGLDLYPTLAPDGASFAYVSAHSGNRDIYVQRVDGRAAVNITADSPDDDSEPAFSPDGSQIAFRSERGKGGVFLMGVTGESVRRLTDFGYNPSWSPDGKQIVVATERVELQPRSRRVRSSELWVIDTLTGAKRALIRNRPGGGNVDAVQPSWSPDGTRIAFWGLSDASGNRDLSTIEPGAPNPEQTLTRLTADTALDWNPIWSPDSAYLYFGSDRDGTMNLWRIAADGGETPEPVSLPTAFSGHFAMTKRGEIVYVAVTRSYRLIALPLDPRTGRTGEPRVVLEGSLETISFEPSPDHRSIAFTTGGAQEDVFVVDADGTRMRQLTNDAARDRGVNWSADGKTLYFYANRSGAYHVWSIAADGGELTRVTTELDVQRAGVKNIYNPYPSPDGRTLAVQTETLPALVRLDGPAARRVETLGTGSDALSFGWPRWSPDGRRLILLRRSGDGGPHPGFFTYSLETRTFQPVLARGHSPQWLPDGKHVVFFEKDRIGIVDADTGQSTDAPFAPLRGVHLDDPTFYPRVSRDGSTLYLRQVLEQGDIWMMKDSAE